MGTEGTYINITKAIYDTLTANISLNGEKLKAFPSNIRNKIRMPTLTTIIQHSFGDPSHGNQRRKRNKRLQIRKEEVKLSLFADDMMLYIENPKEATRKLIELINTFSKLSGYKINTQKYLAFLYTNNGRSLREIKETISLPPHKNDSNK